jgi:Zn-dependent protease with chaperone function
MSWLPLSLSLSSLQTVARISVERILNALPEGFLIAFFAWALLRVLRRQSSGTRFAVWFLALLTVAVLPLLSGVAINKGGALPAPGMSWGHLHPALTIPGSWALFAFVAWALGTCVAMARLAVGLWQLRQLRQSCTAIAVNDLDPAVRRTVEAIVASGSVVDGRGRPSLHRSRSVTVATSELVRVPAAIGFWKRTIILPAWALRELPPEDLNVILLHEFAHLRRGDDWTNLIQKVVRALFFFHPAVWWIESRLSMEREMACDDAVLADTANPQGYANCLVSLLEKSLAHRLSNERLANESPANKRLAEKPRPLAQAAVDRAHEASLRLARILDHNRPVAPCVWKPALGIVGAFSVVCLAVLPVAPQFVTFDRGITAGTSGHVYSAAVRQPSLQMPAVIPAALRTGESPLGTTAGMTTAKMATAKTIHARDAVGRQSAPSQAVFAGMNEQAPSEQVVAINTSASADQEIMPQFQTAQFQTAEFRTVVFFQTTQYVISDSTVWRVQVWHVMLVSQVSERSARVPVVNSL